MKLQSLTASEEEVMRVIWKEGNIYFRDLVNAFPEPKPHQNTISTFLKILVEKNYLNIEKQGRIYLYSAAINLEDYRKCITKRFLENYFDNSGSDMLKLLMEENLIQAEDVTHFFDVKTKEVSLENPIRELIKELTSDKKSRKKDKDKKQKKKK